MDSAMHGGVSSLYSTRVPGPHRIAIGAAFGFLATQGAQHYSVTVTLQETAPGTDKKSHTRSSPKGQERVLSCGSPQLPQEGTGLMSEGKENL